MSDAGYIFDLSALSAWLNPAHQHHASAARVIEALPTEAMKFVSIVTLAEMEYGIRIAEHAQDRRLGEYRQRIEVARQYATLDLTRHTSFYYAELKAFLASQTQPSLPQKKKPRYVEDWKDIVSGKSLQTDENDLWICAQAKERDLVVISGDEDIRFLGSIDPDLRVQFTRDGATD